MPVELDVQYASSANRVADAQAEQAEEPPSTTELQHWANRALREDRSVQVSLRIVDEDESRALNSTWRGRDRPTNVLSFPLDIPDELNMPMLGDLVICAPVVEREAREQHKSSRAHWAHMVIHGMLHLQGYDHIEDEQAAAMESLEIKLLNELGFDNPYESGQ